jgi:hypothetical protein
MPNFAIIKAGKVENIIEYDSQPTTPPPGFGEGYTAVQADRVSPGWLYENGEFIDTTPPVAPLPAAKRLQSKSWQAPTTLQH